MLDNLIAWENAKTLGIVASEFFQIHYYIPKTDYKLFICYSLEIRQIWGWNHVVPVTGTSGVRTNLWILILSALYQHKKERENLQITKTVYLYLQEITCRCFSDAETDYHNRSADIDDIDARLQRIQEMMKNGI